MADVSDEKQDGSVADRAGRERHHRLSKFSGSSSLITLRMIPPARKATNTATSASPTSKNAPMAAPTTTADESTHRPTS
ncbi:hypothetical protein [Halococcus hamelinensis]|uniref:hypothetical protein n=1 Tax=Halococcus hamelinensis TaxID=332168 RepID=UPI0012946AFD|nr:hypothetical protein [Halococcus hamelinensis]